MIFTRVIFPLSSTFSTPFPVKNITAYVYPTPFVIRPLKSLVKYAILLLFMLSCALPIRPAMPSVVEISALNISRVIESLSTKSTNPAVIFASASCPLIEL